jgi:prolyl-tRNA editing enzyme YbaK/EbsC (Cys-tRNA(Pro) deacylase)
LVVLPCNRTLNLQVVADRLKVNRVEIANDQDLSEELRYPPSEASPLGAGEMAVLVDESLLGMSTIIIGGGEAGVAIEIAPVGLCMLTDATVLCLVDELE